MRAGAATARRRRPWSRPRTCSPPRRPRSGCGGSIPATCARTCTRRRSPGRTSRTGRSRSRSSPPLSGWSPSGCRAAVTAPPNWCRHDRDRRVHAAARARGAGPARSSRPAAVLAGPDLAIHFSTGLPDGTWLVEPRIPDGKTTIPNGLVASPRVIGLPGGAELTLTGRATARLWRGRLSTAVLPYLLRYGEPIRYSYAAGPWPLDAYQTVFGRYPGSAEMPSAARPFTPPVVTDLAARGVM